jgi:hypothetical protein
LDYLEKSGSYDEFQGFFKDSAARELFETILEHLVFCVKKKACSQKDAELLLTQSVINFMCTEIEISFIQSYIKDAINRMIKAFDTPTPRETQGP